MGKETSGLCLVYHSNTSISFEQKNIKYNCFEIGSGPREVTSEVLRRQNSEKEKWKLLRDSKDVNSTYSKTFILANTY